MQISRLRLASRLGFARDDIVWLWGDAAFPEQSVKNQTIAAVLLARRPSDASPDALHPGKAEKNDRGKSELFPRHFYGFLWARSPQSFVLPP